MSFRRPKARYRRRNVPPSTSSPAPSDSLHHGPDGRDLVSVSDIPPSKRPRNSKTLFLPGPEQLITLPGRVALTQPLIVEPKNRADKRRDSTPASEVDANQSDLGGADVAFTVLDDFIPVLDFDSPRRRRGGKNGRQRYLWTTHVIPVLLPIYLRILRETESLRLDPKPASLPCACSSIRLINVTCIYFQCKFIFRSRIFVPAFADRPISRCRIHHDQCLHLFASHISASL